MGWPMRKAYSTANEAHSSAKYGHLGYAALNKLLRVKGSKLSRQAG